MSILPPSSPTVFAGVIRRFGQNTGYGFVYSAQLGAEIFFHVNDERGDDPEQKNGPFDRRIPQVGDHIIFGIEPSPRGPRAQPWSFSGPVVKPVPSPRLAMQAAQLITPDEQAFFHSPWMELNARYQIELHWVRLTGLPLRAECTCPITLHSLEKIPPWNKATRAVYQAQHPGSCALHPLRGAPTHFIIFVRNEHFTAKHLNVNLLEITYDPD